MSVQPSPATGRGATADLDASDAGVWPPLPRLHAARLRHYWRSQGWACHDTVDIDLMRWGLIVELRRTRRTAGPAPSCFELTDAGRDALGQALVGNRRRRSRHAQAVCDMAEHLVQAGRLVFTELSVRTVLDERWRLCKPDVYSLVPGLQADHVAPLVHEIKVSRADLLGELRSGKIERYRELAAAIYFVIADGIADADEIPPDYGVIVWQPASDTRIEAQCRVLRPVGLAPRRLEVRHWMALAKARPYVAQSESPQRSL